MDKKWAKALGIAVRLHQPFRALTVMKALLDESSDQLPQVLRQLRDDQIAAILEFATSWNTKTKNSREAQVSQDVTFLLSFFFFHYLT